MKVEKESKVLANTHASSTSTIQQSADIGRQFANVYSECKTITAENSPHDFGLKGFLEDMFDTFKVNGTLVVKFPALTAEIQELQDELTKEKAKTAQIQSRFDGISMEKTDKQLLKHVFQ